MRKKRTAPFIVLGIETSCDETAAAVVQGCRAVLGQAVASSLPDHQRYGGIVPEIAARRQLELILPVCRRAVASSGLTLTDVDAVAVTQKPGLIGSLLVGQSFARTLAWALNKPLIAVDHIEAHLYAAALHPASHPPHPIVLPAVGLVVSGGHTSLYLIEPGWRFRLLGRTRDDAAGEAFDKVARLLGLDYPGGPAIQKIAEHGRPQTWRPRCARLSEDFAFSFSGLKTAVLYHLKSGRPPQNPADIAWAFQETVTGVLTEAAVTACERMKSRTLIVGGGVAANRRLRERLGRETAARQISLHIPPMSLCLDNAAMIAGLGAVRLNAGASLTPRETPRRAQRPSTSPSPSRKRPWVKSSI